MSIKTGMDKENEVNIYILTISLASKTQTFSLLPKAFVLI